MFITINEACNKVDGLSRERLINLIKRDEVNGILVERGQDVVEGFVDDNELKFIKK